jgi:hypothetical protein
MQVLLLRAKDLRFRAIALRYTSFGFDAVDDSSMGTRVRCIAPVALPGQRPQRKDTRYLG